MTSDLVACSLTDLHTHILPSVDDGADCLDTAIEMLHIQKNNGIERVALTPHFYPKHEELDAFVDRRNRSYAALLSRWDCESMPQLRLGAEVRYTPALLQMDLHQLTIGEGNYLLLELEDSGLVTFIDQVVKQMIDQGIIPILAHVERCSALRNDPNLLLNLVRMGALAQISVNALRGRKPDKFAEICLRHGLVHIIASDVHNLTDRAACLRDISTERYMHTLAWTERLAKSVWDGTPLPAFAIKPIKRGLFGYH